MHNIRMQMLSDNNEIRPIDNRFNGKMGSHYDLKAMFRVGRMTPIERITAAMTRPQRRDVPLQGRTQFVPARMLPPTVGGYVVGPSGRGIDISPRDVTAARTLDVEGDDGADIPDGSELEEDEHPDDNESTCSGRSGVDNAVHMRHEFERLRAAKIQE